MDLPHLLPPNLQVDRLTNGLELIVAPRPDSPLVGLELAYRVGSRNDPPGRGGLAHLFEHMLFQGSEHVAANEHFAQLERIGGVANASTSRDRTVYWEALPAEHLDLALWLESDRMGFLLPGLDADNLENQRGVVLAERAQRVDNQPWGIASELASALPWTPAHPYHHPVIGSSDEIRAISLDDARAFFGRHYRPGNAVLALVGGVEPEHARERIGYWFEEIGSDGNGPAALPSAPSPALPRREVVSDRVPLARIWLSWPLPAASDPEHAVAEMTAAALGSGRSSPLDDRLVRQRGLAQDVGCGVAAGELASTFVVVATARPGITAEALEAAVLAEVALLAKVGPSLADLERASRGAVVGLLGAVERVEGLADLLCLAQTRYGDLGVLDSIPRRWLATTPRQVVELALCRLDPERASVVVCEPEAHEVVA